MDDHAPAPHSFETLQRSAQELTAIFDSDAMAIAVVAKGVFVRCNRKYEHLYGYAPEVWWAKARGWSLPVTRNTPS